VEDTSDPIIEELWFWAVVIVVAAVLTAVCLCGAYYINAHAQVDGKLRSSSEEAVRVSALQLLIGSSSNKVNPTTPPPRTRPMGTQLMGKV
jgi:hypothetical protein